MGLFKSKKPGFVAVTYHDLSRRAPEDANRDRHYTFRWTLKTRPAVDMWLWVEGTDGPTTGVISSLNADTSWVHALKVLRLVTEDEIHQFAELREHNAQMKIHNHGIWLDMARAKAGLPVARELPSRVPDDFEPIPPVTGRVTGERAKDRGRIWWMLYKRAEEAAWPEAEVTRFKEIADFWYAQSRVNR